MISSEFHFSFHYWLICKLFPQLIFPRVQSDVIGLLLVSNQQSKTQRWQRKGAIWLLLKCLVIHFLLIDYNQLQYNQFLVAALIKAFFGTNHRSQAGLSVRMLCVIFWCYVTWFREFEFQICQLAAVIWSCQCANKFIIQRDEALKTLMVTYTSFNLNIWWIILILVYQYNINNVTWDLIIHIVQCADF